MQAHQGQQHPYSRREKPRSKGRRGGTRMGELLCLYNQAEILGKSLTLQTLASF